MIGSVLRILLLLLFLSSIASAQTIDIRPQAPPGLGEKISMLLGWVYWIAIVAAIFGVIWSAVSIYTGREGKAMLIISLVVLAFLVALPEILKALGV
ncbi:MAG: hypothetical protein QW328_10035 [Nitrososphaerota archaeon]